MNLTNIINKDKTKVVLIKQSDNKSLIELFLDNDDLNGEGKVTLLHRFYRTVNYIVDVVVENGKTSFVIDKPLRSGDYELELNLDGKKFPSDNSFIVRVTKSHENEQVDNNDYGIDYLADKVIEKVPGLGDINSETIAKQVTDIVENEFNQLDLSQYIDLSDLKQSIIDELPEQIKIEEIETLIKEHIDNIVHPQYELEVDRINELIDEKISEIPEPKEVDLSNYATKDDVNERISEIPKPDLSGYVKEHVLNEHILESEHKLKDFVTKESLETRISEIPKPDLSDYATEQYVNDKFDSIPEHEIVDLSDYATKGYVEDIVKTIPETDLTGYVTKDDLETRISEIPEHEIVDLSNYPTKDELNERISEIPKPDLSEYVTEHEFNEHVFESENKLKDFVTRDGLETRILEIPEPDLSNYVTENDLELRISQIPEPKEVDLSNHVTKDELDERINGLPEPDLSNYATEQYVNEQISNLPKPKEVDLSGYVKKDELNIFATKDELNERIDSLPEPDLSDYVKHVDLNENIENVRKENGELYESTRELLESRYDQINQDLKLNYVTHEQSESEFSNVKKDLIENVDQKIDNLPKPKEVDLSNHVTKDELDEKGYATEQYVDSKIKSSVTDGYRYYGTVYVDVMDYDPDVHEKFSEYYESVKFTDEFNDELIINHSGKVSSSFNNIFEVSKHLSDVDYILKVEGAKSERDLDGELKYYRGGVIGLKFYKLHKIRSSLGGQTFYIEYLEGYDGELLPRDIIGDIQGFIVTIYEKE